MQITRNRTVLPLFVVWVAFSACQRKSGESKPDWAIDFMNDPRHFRVNEKMTYDDVKATSSVDTKEVPWADTYWPYVDRGLSFRAEQVPLAARAGGGGWASTGAAAFLASHVAAIQQGSAGMSLLSPAEKHDILLRALNGTPLDPGSALGEISALASMEDGIDATGDMAQKKALSNQMSMRLNGSWLSSLMPLSTSGYSNWFRFASNPRYKFGAQGAGYAWDWMGHCHGWAAAAILEERPKHAVMAKYGDVSLLLTEGDIRGLLTKAWADNPIEGRAHYAGKRCGVGGSVRGGLPTDDAGRVFGGEVSSPLIGGKLSFHELEETRRFNTPAGRMETVYTLYLPQTEQTVYYLDPQVTGVAPMLFTSFLKLNKFLSSGDASLGARASAKFYGCRDSNPAAVHTLLARYLGHPDPDGKVQRLIMDRAPGGQVWNQPIYRADFETGDLIEIAKVPDDTFARYRAAGTAYVAEVTTKIFWVTESDWPYPHYTEEFDQGRTYTITLTYTLEFDADKVLIGGEWGHIGTGTYTGWYPDFLWAYSPGSHPTDSSRINYTRVIKPIHRCSLLEPTGETNFGGRTLAYTDCDLAAAPTEPAPTPQPTAEPMPIGPAEPDNPEDPVSPEDPTTPEEPAVPEYPSN